LEKGAISFQNNQILQKNVFPRMKRLIPSFWALTENISIIRHAREALINRWVKMDQEQAFFVWPCFGDIVAFGTGGIRH